MAIKTNMKLYCSNALHLCYKNFVFLKIEIVKLDLI